MIRFCLPIACLIMMSFVSEARAQRIPGYSRGNTVSPYINLFRGNTSGAIGNYFTLVRPMQNQLRFNQMQLAVDRRFQQQLMMNRTSQFGLPPVQPAIGGLPLLRPGSQDMVQPTQAASYFNYSHFYGVPVTGAALGTGPRMR